MQILHKAEHTARQHAVRGRQSASAAWGPASGASPGARPRLLVRGGPQPTVGLQHTQRGREVPVVQQPRDAVIAVARPAHHHILRAPPRNSYLKLIQLYAGEMIFHSWLKPSCREVGSAVHHLAPGARAALRMRQAAGLHPRGARRCGGRRGEQPRRPCTRRARQAVVLCKSRTMRKESARLGQDDTVQQLIAVRPPCGRQGAAPMGRPAPGAAAGGTWSAPWAKPHSRAARRRRPTIW